MKFYGRVLCGMAALLLLVSAQASAQDLVGKWTGKMQLDEEKFIASLPKEQQEPAAKELTLKTIKSVIEQFKIDIDFKADGTMTAISGPGADKKTEEGKYEVVKKEGTTWTVKSTHPGKDGAPARTEEIKIVFEGDKAFELIPPGKAPAGMKIRFTKQ